MLIFVSVRFVLIRTRLGKNSTMQTGPGETAPYPSLLDVRERQAASGTRYGYSPENIKAFMPDDIRQAEERRRS